MPRKSKTHKCGGIHGICVLVMNAYASNCSVVTEFMSVSVVWLHISKPVIGYEFLLGAVYLPHDESTYYSDDPFENMACLRYSWGTLIPELGLRLILSLYTITTNNLLITIHISYILRRIFFI